MLEQAQDFLAESQALHDLVANLTDEEMAERTAFKGWTINNVVGHLYMWNWAADLSRRDTQGFRDFQEEIARQLGAKGRMLDFEARWRNRLRGRALVEAWRKNFEEVAQGFADADPKARVPWAGPDMSVRSSITARLMETWAHGQEVYDQLGEVRINADRIRNIVVLGVNTYGWTFQVREETPPQPVPFLRLIAPSGEIWEYGEASDEERIDGLAEEFCQVVTQVRNIADTSLEVTGDNAANWMSKAQCFAGPPEPPPPPGTRRTMEPR